MKALALSVAVVLMAGVVAVADDHPRVVVPNDEAGGLHPFPNRSFVDVATSVSEAPTGRFMAGVRNEKDSKSQELQFEKFEKRLEDIEKKLDRVLKELKDMRNTSKPVNYFNFSVGAYY